MLSVYAEAIKFNNANKSHCEWLNSRKHWSKWRNYDDHLQLCQCQMFIVIIYLPFACSQRPTHTQTAWYFTNRSYERPKRFDDGFSSLVDCRWREMKHSAPKINGLRSSFFHYNCNSLRFFYLNVDITEIYCHILANSNYSNKSPFFLDWIRCKTFNCIALCVCWKFIGLNKANRTVSSWTDGFQMLYFRTNIHSCYINDCLVDIHY